MLGQVLDGKYEIIASLGAGAMGAVYQARDKETGLAVAVKVISAAHLSPKLLARFEREAAAATKVRSPHIVETLCAGRDPDGRPYIVMELLEGANALQLLDRLGPLPPDLAVRIGVQTCLGLEAAHAEGVLHRDIKPANLLLAARGAERVVKLLDFGVAKFKMDRASDEGLESLTRTGSVLGSPLYLSPEQARGLKTIDHRADLWSLGVVLYELLSGDTPHPPIDALGELIITICEEQPEPLPARAPWVPTRVAQAVHGALHLDPDKRYDSARAMREALLACLADPTDHGIRADMVVELSEQARAARPSLRGVDDQAATLGLYDEPAPPSIGHARTLADKPAEAPPPPSAPVGTRRSPARAKRSSAGMTVAVMALGLAIGAAMILALRCGQNDAPAPPAHHK